MIPALGFIWIFAKYISRLKEKIALSLVFLIVIPFIPSIILNAYSYKSELGFFQRVNKKSPGNSYILLKIATAFYEKKDYLASELSLNRALSCEQRKETAMLVSLLYSDIELKKADYKKVFKWLENIEDFASSPDVELAPLMKFQIDQKKALVYIAQGNIESAEKLLIENIERQQNNKKPYEALYQMYIGYNMWEKAKNLEKIVKGRFPSYISIDTIQREREFNSLSTEEKIGFYIRYRNFHKAIGIIKTLAPLDLDHKILLSKLYYWRGKEEEAKNIINEIFFEYSDDFRVLNTIGNYYLKDLIRVNEALSYFKKSLEINKNQPEVAYLVRYLNDTLNKMKEVWPTNPK